MPGIQISKDGHIIEEKQFEETLLVIGQKDLSWHFYPSEEGMWTTCINYKKAVIPDQKVKDGGRQLTITHTMQGYEVSCILPEWEFSINGSKMPKGFYDTFLIAWKVVELSYSGYEFIFTFDISDGGDEDVPRPIY